MLNKILYIVKTTFFFLFVGGLIGTTLTLPFAETLTHHPFRIPETLYMLLLGYVLIGMPVASLTGVLYGTFLATCKLANARRTLCAFGFGTVPPLLFVVFVHIYENGAKRDFDLSLAAILMLFTGFSSLATARVHTIVERKFSFFRSGDCSNES